MSETVIRPVVAEDARGIVDIYAPIVERTAVSFEDEIPSVEEMQRRIERTTATYPWLVAERGAQIVGYAYATSFRARAAYRLSAETSVYVSEGARGKGLGSALMRELIDVLRSADFRTLVAGITLPNDASVRLHESLGFAASGVIPRAGRKFNAWHDLGFWTRVLDR